LAEREVTFQISRAFRPPRTASCAAPWEAVATGVLFLPSAIRLRAALALTTALADLIAAAEAITAAVESDSGTASRPSAIRSSLPAFSMCLA
jgi:hypothetical protein